MNYPGRRLRTTTELYHQGRAVISRGSMTYCMHHWRAKAVSRRHTGPDLVTPLILLSIVAYVFGFTAEEAGKVLVVAAVTFTGVMLLLVVSRSIRHAARVRLLRSADMALIDMMSGLEFEKFVAELLKKRGFTGIRLTERYDWGVDIIAHKDGIRWGVQTKRSSGLVKVAAVRQVVAGLRVYGCERSMVITNGLYSKTATQLAHANQCVLVDRCLLASMVSGRSIIGS